MLADLVAHEVGHTLGLRHNFKASSVYTLAEINSEEWKGKKPFTGSVMDYNPANFNMESGELQGDYAMNGVGPYDYWAIEFGYTFGDTKETLKRVAEPELAYLTDDDTRGPLWLEDYPEWDPRIILASPARREELLARRERGESVGMDLNSMFSSDPALMENEELAMLNEWMGENNAMCLAAHGRAFDMAFGNLTLEMLGMLEDDPKEEDDTEMLDGIPEWFIGPMLADLVAHEVGHTLGLRHNFKASSVYTLAEINSEEWKGKKPFTGSVMDYNPANFNMESGELQGDYAMNGVGPYDYWAIEFGYTFGDTKETLKRVAEPELAYLTDDDTRGPDPLARRYDFGQFRSHACRSRSPRSRTHPRPSP